MKRKRLITYLFGSSLLLFVAGAFAISNNYMNNKATRASGDSCDHVGNYYPEKKADEHTTGNIGFCACCKCHERIDVDDPSSLPTGEWTTVTSGDIPHNPTYHDERKIYYFVTFDSNGGIGGTSSLNNVREGVDLPNITCPVLKGYGFLGYYYNDVQYYDKNGVGVREFDLRTNNIEFKAKWENAKYNVIKGTCENVLITAQAIGTYKEDLNITFNNVAKVGYNVSNTISYSIYGGDSSEGILLDSGNVNSGDSIAFNMDGDFYTDIYISASASATAKTFNVHEGLTSDASFALLPNSGTFDSILSFTPIKGSATGYTFSDNINVIIHAGSSGGDVIFNKNITSATIVDYVMNINYYSDIYVDAIGSKTADSFSIVYNANGGDGVMSTTLATYDRGVSLVLNLFTRTGYDFLGWARTPGGEVVYSNGATLSVSEVNALYSECGKEGTINLYAKWLQKSFLITTGNDTNVTPMNIPSMGLYATSIAMQARTNDATGYSYSDVNYNVYAGTSSAGTLIKSISGASTATVNFLMSSLNAYYENIYVYMSATKTAKTYSVVTDHDSNTVISTSSSGTFDSLLAITFNHIDPKSQGYDYGNISYVIKANNSSGTTLKEGVVSAGSVVNYTMSGTYYSSIYIYSSCGRSEKYYSASVTSQVNATCSINASSLRYASDQLVISASANNTAGYIFSNLVVQVKNPSGGLIKEFTFGGNLSGTANFRMSDYGTYYSSVSVTCSATATQRTYNVATAHTNTKSTISKITSVLYTEGITISLSNEGAAQYNYGTIYYSISIGANVVVDSATYSSTINFKMSDHNQYDSSVTITAWCSKSAKSCNISLNLNGGASDSCVNSINHTYGNSEVLPIPMRWGYTFDGWYESNTKYTSVPSSWYTDHTLTANWTAKTYQLASKVSTSSHTLLRDVYTVTPGNSNDFHYRIEGCFTCSDSTSSNSMFHSPIVEICEAGYTDTEQHGLKIRGDWWPYGKWAPDPDACTHYQVAGGDYRVVKTDADFTMDLKLSNGTLYLVTYYTNKNGYSGLVSAVSVPNIPSCNKVISVGLTNATDGVNSSITINQFNALSQRLTSSGWNTEVGYTYTSMKAYFWAHAEGRATLMDNAHLTTQIFDGSNARTVANFPNASSNNRLDFLSNGNVWDGSWRSNPTYVTPSSPPSEYYTMKEDCYWHTFVTAGAPNVSNRQFHIEYVICRTGYNDFHIACDVYDLTYTGDIRICFGMSGSDGRNSTIEIIKYEYSTQFNF